MQPIRTYAEMPLEFDIPLDEPHTYQQLRDEAFKLFAQGLSFVKIAKLLGVTDKTVKKAIAKG